MVDTRISLRGSQTDKIKGSDLNLFVTTYFWRGAPLIADDYARATLGTSLRWDFLALFHQVKTDFGRAAATRFVWPGIEGSHEDQAINGVLYLLQPEIASAYMDELPIDQVDLARLEVILRRWERYAEELLKLRTEGNPIVVPEAPKPQTPPPVVEAPKPEPYGWWDCPKCGEVDNPPKSQKCMKCHASRPTENKPDEAPVAQAKDPNQWRKVVAGIAAALGAAGFMIKLFLPAIGDAIYDAVVALLRAIGG